MTDAHGTADPGRQTCTSVDMEEKGREMIDAHSDESCSVFTRPVSLIDAPARPLCHPQSPLMPAWQTMLSVAFSIPAQWRQAARGEAAAGRLPAVGRALIVVWRSFCRSRHVGGFVGKITNSIRVRGRGACAQDRKA